MPLETEFDALIDGQTATLILQPVHAPRLGSSRFTTSGAVVKFDPQSGRTIDLTTHIKSGKRCGTSHESGSERSRRRWIGLLDLGARIQIPPLSRKGARKSCPCAGGILRFATGSFCKSALEQRITDLSHRSEGHPKTADEDTDQAISK